jgi:hypothetical protein
MIGRETEDTTVTGFAEYERYDGTGLAGHGKTAMKGLERGSISDRAVLACSVARRGLP